MSSCILENVWLECSYALIYTINMSKANIALPNLALISVSLKQCTMNLFMNEARHKNYVNDLIQVHSIS